ncbi:hypothetical protein TIFTF001_035577 [Ficus carica]|uniref:Uncharacterized protein n=1 Tax=Ficus carica TaxID=3494 RepID=A0AA88E262_FICCA|nr:hypothetical protein TIFTF001_035557 [Ficus carica]GMN66509.1 hypothetical protein TIFTF001_035577 [Ficus carica]
MTLCNKHNDIIIDEDTAIKKLEVEESIKVPVGPVIRARAKHFQKELNNLIRKVQQEDLGMFTNEGQQRLVHLIKVNSDQEDQLCKSMQ